ncbi:DNA-directed DNA polymerase [Aureococcus anophagefferens]|nr:DNA-directed DNA polymerase [Aureococcus anophagefferens]
MKHTLAGNMHFGKKGSVFGEVADCGAASFMGICRLDSLPHRRIDAKVYAAALRVALLYFTGSDHFNRSMRCFAKAKGFTLCDRGLRPTVRRGKATDSRGKYVDNKVAVGRPVEFEREEDVFAFLELPYKTPPERALDDNAAGIAAAAARVRREQRRRRRRRRRQRRSSSGSGRSFRCGPAPSEARAPTSPGRPRAV